MTCAGQGRRRATALGRVLLIASIACLLLPAGAASAAESSATTVSNPLVSDGVEIGRSTLSTGYTTSPDNVDVSTATEIRLEPGKQFRATVCLNVHVLHAAPEGQCVARDIDTRAATAAKTYVAAPVSRTVDRPAVANTGFATQHVVVTYADWTLLANSWPADDLAGASLPLFAVGATSGPLPEQQGVALESSPLHGGANTALPDSICVSNPWPPATPRPDLDSAGLGAMPFHYEVGEPSGAYAGQTPRGVLILLHGGGWTSNGGGAAQSVRGEADRWRARGWRTVNSSYRPCGRSVGDALSLYDRVRATYGAASPVCALGQSAGGHLALMIAARRPGGVSCVIDQAGPTDAASLAVQAAHDPATGATQSNGPKAVHNMMVAAFGQENLATVSPVRLAAPALRGTRVLAATAAHDNLIPHSQMTMLRDAMRADDPTAYVDTMQLAGGDQPFVHGYVSAAALAAYHQAERDLVASFAPDIDPASPPPPAGEVPRPTVTGPAQPAGDAAGTAPAPFVAPMPRPAPQDRTPPAARLSVQREQRVGPGMAVVVTCLDERCHAAAHAAVTVPRLGARRPRTYTARVSRTSIAAGARGRVVIRISQPIRAAAARALRAGRKVSVRVVVVVADAHGNRRTLARRVALTR